MIDNILYLEARDVADPEGNSNQLNHASYFAKLHPELAEILTHPAFGELKVVIDTSELHIKWHADFDRPEPLTDWPPPSPAEVIPY